jgi:hypothetical protein
MCGSSKCAGQRRLILFGRFIFGCTLHWGNPEIPSEAGGGKSTGKTAINDNFVPELCTSQLAMPPRCRCREQLSGLRKNAGPQGQQDYL